MNEIYAMLYYLIGAAIDYLFLKHHLGCTAVRQMCCFNLTDNYHAIETNLRNLHDLVNKVKQSDG